MYKTKSKEKIYNFFIINKEKSFSGNDLVNEFAGEMDKSTIYRQVKKLESKKILIKSFNNSKNIYEYQYLDNINHNLHLICNKCGKTINLNCKVAEQFMTHILDDHGFSVDKFSSSIYGLCKGCE